jgi:hypothetical protein
MIMKQLLCRCIAVVAATALAPVWAFNSNVPQAGLPSAAQYSAQVLPELKGVVSWKTLGQVEPVKQGGKIVPRFSKDILALDQQKVTVQGFMLPIDMTEKQKHFLISAVPPHCPFCLPAGSEALIEVQAKDAITFGFEPVMLSGKLSVLKNDSSGLLYRLTEAEAIETKLKKQD